MYTGYLKTKSFCSWAIQKHLVREPKLPRQSLNKILNRDTRVEGFFNKKVMFTSVIFISRETEFINFSLKLS
jgi:hypothetical protein